MGQSSLVLSAFFPLLIFLWLGIGSVQSQINETTADRSTVTTTWPTTTGPPNNCPNEENYRPCDCRKDGPNGLSSVSCWGQSVDVVEEVFSRTSAADLYTVDIYFYLSWGSNESYFLPSDLLANKRAQILLLSGSYTKSLEVNPAAFRSSKNYTTKLSLESFNLNETSWVFLEGFEKLEDIRFISSNEPHKTLSSTLPALHSLTRMEFTQCTGLQSWTSFPNLTRGLVDFALTENLRATSNDTSANPQNPEHVSRILKWVSNSSSETLKRLSVVEYGLDKIPDEIVSFPKLVDLTFRFIPDGFSGEMEDEFIVESGSLAFTSSPERVNLNNSFIKEFQAGAFQGDFGHCMVDVSENLLTRFESSVFQPMLEAMAAASAVNQTTAGYLIVGSNPFDCEKDLCHMAWLFRDNRKLLPAVHEGYCWMGDDRYPFGLIAPGLFSECPVEVDNSSAGTAHPAMILVIVVLISTITMVYRF